MESILAWNRSVAAQNYPAQSFKSAISTIFSVFQDYSVLDSLDTAENNKENDEGTDVYFEILTNWGNPNYLGLTEVCQNTYTVEPHLRDTSRVQTSVSTYNGQLTWSQRNQISYNNFNLFLFNEGACSQIVLTVPQF